jgi:hypothetical protein
MILRIACPRYILQSIVKSKLISNIKKCSKKETLLRFQKIRPVSRSHNGNMGELRYSIHNDHISYLVYGWWDFCKHGIILKSLSNENYPP